MVQLLLVGTAVASEVWWLARCAILTHGSFGTLAPRYLSTVDPSTLPPADSYNAAARGTPDVAALGEGFQVIVGGTATSVGGTSASSPTFAGLVSLLNEARLTAGKPAMGFLNPFVSGALFTFVWLGTVLLGMFPRRVLHTHVLAVSICVASCEFCSSTRMRMRFSTSLWARTRSAVVDSRCRTSSPRLDVCQCLVDTPPLQ